VLIRLERQPGGDEAQQVAVEKVRSLDEMIATLRDPSTRPLAGRIISATGR
jgi:hypothetical protein